MLVWLAKCASHGPNVLKTQKYFVLALYYLYTIFGTPYCKVPIVPHDLQIYNFATWDRNVEQLYCDGYQKTPVVGCLGGYFCYTVDWIFMWRLSYMGEYTKNMKISQKLSNRFVLILFRWLVKDNQYDVYIYSIV